jgi:membrane-bound lytic murein transglycosylase B
VAASASSGTDPREESELSEPATHLPDSPKREAKPRFEPPARRRRLLKPVLAILGVCALLGVVVVAALTRAGSDGSDKPRKPRFTVAALTPKPGSVVPHKAAPVPAKLAAWSEGIAERTDIPARVVLAYGTAERKMRALDPGCRISWATLAGLGRVESSHGEYGGAEVRPDGTLSKPIIGVPLDGHEGVLAIKDTDGGKLDGDPTWDRAVGAMQFVPATWHKWGMRASGDGRDPDPQNVDDAALTSARYLCGTGGDLSTPRGWWRGVLTYNKSVSYGRKVFSGADAYARVTVSATG